LYNTHVAVDKARNLVVDNSYIKGLLLLKKGPTAKPNIAPLTVHHPVAYVSEGYEVVPQSMPADIQDFLQLDRFISQLAEIQVGTFLPGSPVETAGTKTASEVHRLAAIENQLRQGILMRFSRQFSQAVDRMQRGICHPEHLKAAADLKGQLDMVRQTERGAIWARREVVEAFNRSFLELPRFLVPFEVPEHLDEDAIFCCLELLEKNIPPADILLMAYSPASELIPDTMSQDTQVLDLMIQRYMGNPNIDQDALMKLDWVKKLGETTANEVILPKDAVEAIAIEATRQQILELQAIVSGQNIPVSPRDNDLVHLDTMVQKLMPVIAGIPAGSLPPEAVNPMIEAMKHFSAHVQAAEMKGAPTQKIAEYKQQYKEALNHLTKGQGAPPTPDIAPAAAMRAGGARPTGAAMRESGQIYEQQQGPSQNSVISGVANPPRPPTAA
jgi:hypothetical protein